MRRKLQAQEPGQLHSGQSQLSKCEPQRNANEERKWAGLKMRRKLQALVPAAQPTPPGPEDAAEAAGTSSCCSSFSRPRRLGYLLACAEVMGKARAGGPEVKITESSSGRFALIIIGMFFLLGFIAGACGVYRCLRKSVATRIRYRGPKNKSLAPVYTTMLGECYHLERDCRGLRSAKELFGWRPCKLCAEEKMKKIKLD